MADLIKNRLEEMKKFRAEVKTKAPNSARAEQVGHLISFMKETSMSAEETELSNRDEAAGLLAYKTRINRRFKYWLGRTRHLTPAQLFRIMKQAKAGKNPQGLFEYLLKGSKPKKELST